MSGKEVWKPFVRFEYQKLLPEALRNKVRTAVARGLDAAALRLWRVPSLTLCASLFCLYFFILPLSLSDNPYFYRYFYLDSSVGLWMDKCTHSSARFWSSPRPRVPSK